MLIAQRAFQWRVSLRTVWVAGNGKDSSTLASFRSITCRKESRLWDRRSWLDNFKKSPRFPGSQLNTASPIAFQKLWRELTTQKESQTSQSCLMTRFLCPFPRFNKTVRRCAAIKDAATESDALQRTFSRNVPIKIASHGLCMGSQNWASVESIFDLRSEQRGSSFGIGVSILQVWQERAGRWTFILWLEASPVESLRD